MKTNGFTIIELIIGIAISSIISIILFQSFSQTSKTIKTIDTMIFMDRRVSVLQNQLDKDITAIFMPEQLNHEKLERYFYSQNNQNQLKEFTFITTNALQVYQSTSPRIVRVTYQLREIKSSPNEFSLFRKESTNLIFGAEKDAVEYELTDFIKSFSLEFGYKEIKKTTEMGKPKQTEEIKILKEWIQKEPDLKRGETYKIPNFVNIKVSLWDGALHKTSQDFEFKYIIYSPQELKPKQPEKPISQKDDNELISELTSMSKRVMNLTQPPKNNPAKKAGVK
ncbi:MAG: prepilin-type N-terminal cleavage/methylation domain-containing protein [Candidatus Babeliales bacterium]|nr:prepilin-type N-terminal cleavage/methylation domain-containing protein [Candidatus Babeliales bacterium]